jgi:adenine/guanine phosphoribosyltransferase-like PRPP-binding protein
MTSPRRPRSVFEASAPLEHYLISVPPVGFDVCPVCRGAVYGGYDLCYPCNDARSVLRDLRLNATAFVSLAPVGDQIAQDLQAYKRSNVPQYLRQSRIVGLSAALWRWLAAHEKCVASAAGADSFDLITTVPSTSGRTDAHPVDTLVGKIVVGSAERVVDVLELARTDLGPRAQAKDRFNADRGVFGRNVLIIDDTWTTGAKMQSASAALKQAGAHRVGGVAIGRWFRPDYKDNAPWLKAKRRDAWSWEECCFDRDTRGNVGLDLGWPAG